MVRTGLEQILNKFPQHLKNKRVGLLCHAASITSKYNHAINCFKSLPCTLSALFGPQHGMFGQTQDNMVEWEGFVHPTLKIPVFSLYGKQRKPTSDMLAHIDALVVDLQDVGARPYTYIWTIKLCMEACMEKGLTVWVLDRPNPIGPLPFDGPMLLESYHSFVGGAPIPLCHRLTLGEIATLLKDLYFPSLDLEVAWMEGWKRNLLFQETGLPWVLPSPNMPTPETAMVYPGMVLLEATDLSEGRGTTRPFEIIGAPYLNIEKVISLLNSQHLPGCVFREHGFIPTFQKWHGRYCNGLQVHVTDPSAFFPVHVTAALLAAIIETSSSDFHFKDPPYEYENIKMPFDILAGSKELRTFLENREPVSQLREIWKQSYSEFESEFGRIAHYPED
jgi:uncharacterized protein YbbC (DUF1343 family)